MEEELLDIYDINGKSLGKVLNREACHAEDAGVFHKAVHVIIVNPTTKEVLLSRHSPQKRRGANLWNIPAAGHVAVGEKLADTCEREVMEEIGLSIQANKFSLKVELLNAPRWEFREIFLAETAALDISNAVLDPKEIGELKWIPYRDFEELLYSAEFVPHDEDYKDIIFDIITGSLCTSKESVEDEREID